MNDTNINEAWDRKKIIIAVLMIVLFGVLAYSFRGAVLEHFLGQNSSKVVKGTSTVKNDIDRNFGAIPKSAAIPIQTIIKEKLDNLKKEVNNLSIEDIATSSPQIRKIISDFNSLKEYPVNEAKEICQKICRGI